MLWAYMYMRKLADKDIHLFHKTILAEPAVLLPCLYTPTGGEACQKFGMMPMYERGMYISIQDKGNLMAVIKEYAEVMLPKDADGKPILATEGEKRVRAATDALSQSKAPRVGKLRQAPEEEKFDLAAA